jgi:hypothetical protein
VKNSSLNLLKGGPAANIPAPNFNATFVSMVEFVFGLLLIFGALTPLASMMLGSVMVVTIATTAIKNIKATSPLGWLSEFLYLPESALSRNPVLALSLGPRLVQRRSFDPAASSPLAKFCRPRHSVCGREDVMSAAWCCERSGTSLATQAGSLCSGASC